MAINHRSVDITLDKNDEQQLKTGEPMIDVGLPTCTHREVTAGNITIPYHVTRPNCLRRSTEGLSKRVTPGSSAALVNIQPHFVDHEQIAVYGNHYVFRRSRDVKRLSSTT